MEHTGMKTSKPVLEKIAEFEGIRLTAYKCPAGVWTIGAGHTAGVTEGMTITKEQAMRFLEEDIQKSEQAVNALNMSFTQNQFDALVSFCFNCGAGNLRKLCLGRTNAQIADSIPLYNKGGGKVLKGLVRRREWERALFLTEQSRLNPYPVPDKNLKRGSKGVCVRWLQRELIERGYGILCDGDYGPKTEACVRDYQVQRNIQANGIVGQVTRAALVSGK